MCCPAHDVPSEGLHSSQLNVILHPVFKAYADIFVFLEAPPCCHLLSRECKSHHAAGVVVYNFFEGGIHLAKTAPLHIHTLPVTFGLSAFVFAGHAVFPSIYRSMKDRSQYPRMLDYTYAIVGLVCVLIGQLPTVQPCVD